MLMASPKEAQSLNTPATKSTGDSSEGSDANISAGLTTSGSQDRPLAVDDVQSEFTNPAGLSRVGERSVMVKNIGCRCMADDFIPFLHSLGLEGHFKAVYIPGRSLNGRLTTNFGYAFVVCDGEEDVRALSESLDGRQVQFHSSVRRLSVVLAREQGAIGKRRHFRASA